MKKKIKPRKEYGVRVRVNAFHIFVHEIHFMIWQYWHRHLTPVLRYPGTRRVPQHWINSSLCFLQLFVKFSVVIFNE